MIYISLYQPWATLAVIGAKRNETRSFLTHHRGPLGIAATQSFPRWAKEFAEIPSIQDEIRRLAPDLEAEWGELFPTGARLGTVTLTDCLSTNQIVHVDGRGQLPPLAGTFENMVGDYSINRWMWLLENPQRLEVPIPARGWQRLWHFRGDQGEAR